MFIVDLSISICICTYNKAQITEKLLETIKLTTTLKTMIIEL